jgi:single-strand DNA-binding protein
VAEEPWGTPASSGGGNSGGDGGWSNPGNFNDETPF